MTLTASSRWWMKSSLPTIELWCMQAPCEPCLCSLSVISIWDPRLQGEAFVMGLELLGPPGLSPSLNPTGLQMQEPACAHKQAS